MSSSICIIGYGFVGQAVAGSMNNNSYKIYDPVKYPNRANTIPKFELLMRGVECCFICVPTPMSEDGKLDSCIMTETLDLLLTIQYQGIVVIKSTCLWEHIETYSKDLHIVCNPEFLTQNNSIHDFENQKQIVIGCDNIEEGKRLEFTYKNYFNLPKLEEYIYCSCKEAIQLKYTHNIYHAYKILFWNYVQEMTGNERKIFNMYSKIRGVTESQELARLCADGRPGYGGACFIKDVGAQGNEFPHVLTDMMIEYNKSLRNNEP